MQTISKVNNAIYYNTGKSIYGNYNTKNVNISISLTLINHVHVRPLIYPIMSIQSECPALKFIVPPHPTRKKTRKTYELKKLDKSHQSCNLFVSLT